MASKGQLYGILILALPLAILLTTASTMGLQIPEIYSGEFENWQIQSRAQDAVDLFVVCPLLLISAIFAYKGKRIFMQLWGGINLYLVYTFVIYCFNIHFNRLFIVYCMTLGLSFYSFLYYSFRQLKQSAPPGTYVKPVIKVTALYFMAIALLFGFLWLSGLMPATINNTVPGDLLETGLFTNPVQVLDLAIILPGFFLTAVFLLSKRPVGLLFAQALLVFCILMDITIGWLAIAMHLSSLAKHYTLVFFMAAITLISSSLLIWYTRTIQMWTANIITKPTYFRMVKNH